MKILSHARDSVINSVFLLAETNFAFAAERLVPLIGNLDIQRDLKSPRFYERLARDITNGCIMPPITIAIIDSIEQADRRTLAEHQQYLIDNIDKFFVLDGIQRLKTLERVIQAGANYDRGTPLYVNILLCPSMDHLLYRMITLNNGQKPMTARHQIEVIASNVYDFDTANLPNHKEKRKPGEKRRRGSFKRVDLIKSYLAFLAASVNIDNDKIVQEKMDDLIASKIMERAISNDDPEFDDVVNKIEEFIREPMLKEWFMNQNNIIGFCAGARNSFDNLRTVPSEEFLSTVKQFEEAFAGLNVSKIKLGSARRKAALLLIERFSKFHLLDANGILDEISTEI